MAAFNANHPRLGSALYHLLLLLGLLILVFILFSGLPANPARSMLGLNASEEAVRALEQELGLDQPLQRQFIRYLSGLVRLDFGVSFVTRRPVRMDLFSAVWATLRYVSIALLFSLIASLTLATMAHFHRRLQRGIWLAAAVVTSLPNLVWALGLGLLILKCQLLVVIPSIQIRYLFMAALALSLYPVATLSQILISEDRRIRRQLSVLAGRSIGLGESRLYFTRVLPQALSAWLAQLSNISASLLAGSVFIEIIFSIPGLGHLVAESVLRQDYPMIQAILIVCFFGFILLNWMLERLYGYLYPGSRVET
ncbi:MAG TPA: ABC transporter permease [bacterium]|nr:ABC transporter permease [bacterium]